LKDVLIKMTIKKYKTFVEGSKKKYDVIIDDTNFTYKINSLKGKFDKYNVAKKKKYLNITLFYKNHVIIVTNKIIRYNFKHGDRLKDVINIDRTIYKGNLYVSLMTKRYIYDVMYMRLVDKKTYDKYDPVGIVKYSDFVKKYPKL
jgi:hypothetical protein